VDAVEHHGDAPAPHFGEFGAQSAQQRRILDRGFTLSVSICVLGRGVGLPDQASKLLSMVRTWSMANGVWPPGNLRRLGR